MIISPASIYQLLFKAGRGRLPTTREALEPALRSCGFPILAINALHAERAAKLDWPHGDPWDRILAAQAQIEGAGLVSRDPAFDRIAIERVW